MVQPDGDHTAQLRRRLQEGLEHGITLVTATMAATMLAALPITSCPTAAKALYE